MDVSVVIPAYESADTISRAVDSALEQGLSDLEVLVVDDGSSDETAAIVQAYDDPRVECIVHEENRGGSAARNTGIERAKGRYIAFLDADDEWHPAKLERQVDCLDARSSEWVAAYCDSRQTHTSLLGKLKLQLLRDKPRKEGGEALIDDLLLKNLEIGGSSTLLVDADVVEAIDGFDETFPRHQDWEFLIRVLKQGRLAYVDEEFVIKHETGGVSTEDVARAKELFLDKFDEEVRVLEAQGYDVTGKHWFEIAMHNIHHGNFRTGASYLHRVNSLGTIQPRFLMFAVSRGVTNRMRASVAST